MSPFELISYELRSKRYAESEFDNFRPCFFSHKTYIFRNFPGKRPLELIFGEFFTARCAEYEFDIFMPFSDFSDSFFVVVLFAYLFFIFGWNRWQRTAKLANSEKLKTCSGQISHKDRRSKFEKHTVYFFRK